MNYLYFVVWVYTGVVALFGNATIVNTFVKNRWVRRLLRIGYAILLGLMVANIGKRLL